jgi:outer membrane protein insertion porin family
MAGPRNGMNLAHRGRAVHGFAAALPLAAAVLGQPVMAQQPVSGQTNAPSSANEAPLPAPIGSDPVPAAAPEPAQIPASAPAPTESLAPAAQTEPRVLISEVVVKGIEGHPERERLELAVYDAMATRPGARVTRSELQNDQ